MKRKILAVFVIVFATLFVASMGCRKSSSTLTEPVVNDTTGGGPVVRKPNIYIYPQSKSVVSIKLEFPMGGTVIESIPTYLGEWRVEVDPSGKIDNKYDYLFYECQTPDAYQYISGWIVGKDSLSIFFRTNLSKTGFNERELNDFAEYWIPRLTDYSYYVIYPQYSNEINRVVRLNVSGSPDSILRLFYAIKGSNNNESNPLEPIIPKFTRKGFVVAEWGVVLK